MTLPEIPPIPNNATPKSCSPPHHRGFPITQLLFDISRSLNRNLNIREALNSGLNALAQETEMMRGMIAVLDRETGYIEINLAYGGRLKHGRGDSCRCWESISGKVMEKGSPAIIQEATWKIQFLENANEDMSEQQSKKIEPASFFCVPMRSSSGEIVGALGVDRLLPTSTTLEEEIRLLADLAGLFAQAVEIRCEAAERERLLREERDYLRSENLDRFNPVHIVGNSHAIRQACRLIHQVASSNACVLLTGESGTGKELAAEAIHINSPRAGNPFIRVNLAALPKNLIESRLFGFKQSPLTNSFSIQKGLLEMANGGTLLLDEISHLPITIQARLLRVLQEKEFERPGSNELVRVDVRILSATNRNLEELIQKFQFRMDLYYQLNLFPIFMPPLRERKTDILILAEHFIGRAEEKQRKHIRRISSCAIDLMMQYHWPGNIRELENCIERAVFLTADGVIYGHHFPRSLQTAEGNSSSLQSRLQTSLAAFEQEMIVDALRSARGNGARAAQALGISERRIRLRIAKYHIDSKSFKRIAASQESDQRFLASRKKGNRNFRVNGKCRTTPSPNDCAGNEYAPRSGLWDRE